MAKWIEYFTILLLVELVTCFGALKSAPRLKHTSPRIIVFKEEDKVRLQCIAKGEPKPEVQWFRDGDPVIVGQRGGGVVQRKKTGTLMIRRAYGAKHAGTYRCKAQNTHGTALGPYTTVIQAELHPFAEHPTLVHNPRVGEPLTLTCTPPSSTPRGNVYWVEKSNPLYKSFTTIDTSVEPGRLVIDNEGNLHFANVKAVDARSGALYACVLQNEVLQSFVMGNTHIVQPIIPRGELPNRPPDLTYVSHTSMQVLRGETVRMKCIFSGYPTPSVHWHRLSENIEDLDDVQLRDGGAELVIPDVQQEDGGRYRCTAIDPNETSAAASSSLEVEGDVKRITSREIDLTVEAAPYWLTEPEDIDASEEDDVIIDCEAGGVPSPTIQWFINGRPVESTSGEDKKDPHMLVGQYQINFLDLDPAMTCVVQCNVSNVHGYLYKNAVLNVMSEPPTFTDEPEATVEAAEGNTVVLPCEGEGAPRPTIIWSKDDQPLNFTRLKRYHRTKKGSLRIMDVRYLDEGIYSCSIKNKYGEVRAESILIIRQVIVKTLPCTEMIPRFIPRSENSLPSEYSDPCDPPVVKEIRFEGDGFVFFDASPSSSPMFTSIAFSFKTSSRDGMLVYLGHRSKHYYLMIALRDGKLVYEHRLGKKDDSSAASVTSPSRYDDGRWHTLHVRRFYRHGVLEIDNMTVLNARSSRGGGSILHHDFVLIGGFNDAHSFDRGYEGCIRNLRFGVNPEVVNFNKNKDFFRAFSGCQVYIF